MGGWAGPSEKLLFRSHGFPSRQLRKTVCREVHVLYDSALYRLTSVRLHMYFLECYHWQAHPVV